MNIEEFRTYCLTKKGATESLPFGDNTLVFKVGNKMFALASVEDFTFANLKCNPEKAIDYRETFQGIQPGYHMSKTHWNSVYVDSDVPNPFFIELIDHSYDLIVKSLTKTRREGL
ncbi:MAG TPA: MmcQ/YjbR family DNA-binding protein [Crocinitomicaceae bacterium]|nr:MmcQ/YjbR family DNA-binding protein [Crocinitomicaceae bacterium]